MTLRNVVLPEPEGPGDRDELARLNRQAEIAQRVRLEQLGAVDLADVLHFKHAMFLG